ncbi:MAG: hypothetical protein E6G14_15675 [Actinobacteria bacterium]|nr:MAG: hypothetical protein E6G14_15675 [Actinomycetota bacterium]
MRDFTEDYAEFFFGRDADRQLITGNLRASRLTLLYAQSGVGKSSLLRAGVVPRLRELSARGADEASARYVPVVFSSWSGNPTTTLLDAIAEAMEPFVGADFELPRGSLLEMIVAATTASDTMLLVILDQFEELFLYHARATEADRFADDLARCVNRSDLRANFLISIREDAYASVGDLLEGRVTNVYGNFLHLDYLDRVAAADAIVKPIERFNELRPGDPAISIEPALVDAVLDQVRRGQVQAAGTEAAPAAVETRSSSDIETTYLQLVMRRLWVEEMAGGSSTLRLQTLERLGGALTIIGAHLDDVLGDLPDDQRDAAATVFRYLVTSTGTKIALSVADLVELSGLPESSVAPMLQRLSAHDMHILRPVVLRDAPEHPRYEIFHDALARPILDWRTRYARQKLDAELDDERRQKELAQQEAHAAAAREASERRRKKLALAGLALAVLLLVGISVAFAIAQKNSADRKAALADSTEIARRISAQGPSLGPDARALAGLEATRLGGSVWASDVMLGVLQSNVGLPAVARGHTRGVLATTFVSNDVVASGSADTTIWLSDRHGRKVSGPLRTFQNAVVGDLATGTIAGRRMLVAARGDGTVDLWDVTRPRHPNHVSSIDAKPGSNAPVNAVALSPDGADVVVGGGDNDVSFWNVTDPVHPRLVEPRLPMNGIVRDLAYDPKGTRLAVATDGGAVLLDFSSTQITPIETGRAVFSVAFAPNGELAYSVEDSSRPGIVLRDAAGATRWLPATYRVNSIAFAMGGKTLLSGGADADVTTWDVATGRPFGPPRMEDSPFYPVRSIAVSPDGTWIAEGSDYGHVKVWPLRVKGALATTIGSFAATDADPAGAGRWALPGIGDVAVGPHGQVAVSMVSRTDSDQRYVGGAVIWRGHRHDGETRLLPFTKVIDGEPAREVAYAGDILVVGVGDHVTTFQTGPRCRTWPKSACELARTKPSRPAGLAPLVLTVGVDGTGKWLSAGDGDGFVTVWELDDRGRMTQVARWNAQGGQVNDVAFSPTARVLATADTSGYLDVWDLRDVHHRRRIAHLKAHDGQPVAAVTFAPGGTRLATGGLDQRVALWSFDLPARRVKPITGLRWRFPPTGASSPPPTATGRCASTKPRLGRKSGRVRASSSITR